MSTKHPIVAVTGSSGAGTTTVKNAFEHIFFRENINPAIIEGDSYHRYNRKEMKTVEKEYAARGENFSHFGPEANVFDTLANTFKEYGETGMCQRRYYLHSDEEAEPYPQNAGEFTDWESIPENTRPRRGRLSEGKVSYIRPATTTIERLDSTDDRRSLRELGRYRCPRILRNHRESTV